MPRILAPSIDRYHIDKSKFTIPFVCGARNLGEAMRRINEVRVATSLQSLRH